jgi:UDP-N-acetylmuramoyl-L-alanyl-D-glutamate--2,6-diaminopimelate ligase
MIQAPLLMPSIFPVTCHTDFVGKGSIFVAIQGYCDNGVHYIKTAIKKGAKKIVINKEVQFNPGLSNYILEHEVEVIRVENTRKALADLSAQVADFPAKKVKIIGITGTKGKTTTSFLLEHCLRVAGYKTGLISSAGNSICGTMFPPSLTTPQPDYLHQFLKLCVDNNVEYVVMEVAAQALSLYRVKGIMFDGVIFTNFSHEHLEFYATLDDYCTAKCQIFDMLHLNAPILVNSDDKEVLRIKKKIPHKKLLEYSFTHKVEYKGIYDIKTMQSIHIDIHYGNEVIHIKCPTLFGQYNAYNILAAVSMAHSLKLLSTWVEKALATFPGVPGRLQHISLQNGARVFIDYAHNPSSFEAVLSTLQLLTDHLIVVFGAGGGKDKIKRPFMGAIACKYANFVILTSDNPRLEKLEDIISDIKSGIDIQSGHKVVVQLDREKAIHKAYKYSKPGSIIALLGKGPDEYQIIGKTKYHFSEQTICKQLE